MASIYLRGEVIWMKFKNATGKHECRSTGYRRGQEQAARELATEVERQAAIERDATDTAARVTAMLSRRTTAQGGASTSESAPAAPPLPAVVEPIGAEASPAALTVRAYGEEWLKRRAKLTTARDEAIRLRVHVFPLVGHMALAEVRPRHIRDLVTALREKTSDAPRCKNEKLAPRTVRHIFGALRVLFKSAVIDEHITASPVMVEKGVLPKNVDKDPAWRSTAIFERDELVTIISHASIPQYRRVHYAFEGLAGVRHGEAAGARWRDYDPKCSPLGKLAISRSGEKDRTKTQITREIPVHPTLAKILAEWKLSGWAEKYGRLPTPDDLILPTEHFKVRKSPNTLKQFHKDLEAVGLRRRRGHDLRRTFITLAQVDGARKDVLRPLTHPGDADIVGLYTTFPWPTICAEVAKLRVFLPREEAPTAAANGGEPGGGPGDTAGDQSTPEIGPPTVAAVAGYIAECSLSDSRTISVESERLLQSGLQVRKAQRGLGRQRADADRRSSSARADGTDAGSRALSGRH